jgi:hypothetical protein
MAKIILETERLLLREFEPADRPIYLYSTWREDFQ